MASKLTVQRRGDGSSSKAPSTERQPLLGSATSAIQSYGPSDSRNYGASSEADTLLIPSAHRGGRRANSSSTDLGTVSDFESLHSGTEATKTEATPLPKLQLFLLLFLQLAEPITYTVIYPFINELILSLGVTHGNERATGYYAGLIESIFFATECLVILQWGRLSDRIGRRPVLMIGAFGLALSINAFGLSRTFAGVVVSRSLSGALNGNIGVIKAMMAEITDETNFDQAISFMPVIWASGNTIGPLIGGALSRPYHRLHPRSFFHTKFWKDYPYFLPCFCASLFSIFAIILTYFLLKEPDHGKPKEHPSEDFTHEDSVDAEVEWGTMASSTAREGSSRSSSWSPDTSNHSFQKPSNQHRNHSPHSTSSSSDDSVPKTTTLRALLTYPVLCVMLNYGLLALLDISYTALIAVFLASKPFAGGIGLSPPQIGVILGVQGLANGIFQILGFVQVRRRLGARQLYQAGIASYIVLFGLFPAMNYLAKSDVREGGLSPSVWVLLIIQQGTFILASMTYNCIFIYITNAAPSRDALGSTNGLAQTVSSFMRALGPASATSLYSLSMEKELLGGYLVYAILIGYTVISVLATTLLPEQNEERNKNLDDVSC